MDGGGASHLEMDDPDAVFPEAFALVRTVREMPDGKVLVADPLGQVLALADMEAGTADTLGGVGPGPDEYMQPDAVWPLPGGKTLLVDLGNSRLTELGPDLAFEDSRSFVVGGMTPGRPLILALPNAVDRDGRVYLRGFGGMRTGVDSAYVLRVDLATGTVDSLARIKTPSTIRTSSGPENNRRASVRQVPLSPADAWGVAEDGRLVIARAEDYSVEWVMLEGSIVHGPPVEYDPLPIGREEKEEWLATSSGSSLSIGISESSDGGMSVQASRGGPSNTDLDAQPWPDALPPFYDSPIRVDSVGRAWVRVHTGADAASAYDLFGPSGEREARVHLRPGRRVAAFGPGRAYVVHTDELGMQHLERYVLP